MADSLNNITLPAGVWVDLYAATGIAIGTQIVVMNLTDTPVKHHAGATVPANAQKDNSTGSFERIMAFREKVNDLGDNGSWAYSHISTGLVAVKVF